jgi:uncharacterized membrane protein (UPF0127 family)
MRNTIILITILGIIALVLGWWRFAGVQSEPVSGVPSLRIGKQSISVEIADSQEERSRGLSGRESLGEEEGMLFIFPELSQRSFRMKDMRFPLDMIFINEGKVVEIVRGVPAPSKGEDGSEIRVASKTEAQWVLEVNSGWVERNGIQLGDEVVLEK